MEQISSLKFQVRAELIALDRKRNRLSGASEGHPWRRCAPGSIHASNTSAHPGGWMQTRRAGTTRARRTRATKTARLALRTTAVRRWVRTQGRRQRTMAVRVPDNRLATHIYHLRERRTSHTYVPKRGSSFQRRGRRGGEKRWAWRALTFAAG